MMAEAKEITVNERKILDLSVDVMRLARNTLLVNLRFLDAAINELRLMPTYDVPFYATEGERLAFNPRHVLRKYRAERESAVHDYLHILLHCLFRHMYINGLVEREVWDLSCDIAAEAMILELGIKSAAVGKQPRLESYIHSLESKKVMITAEKLYHHFRETGLSARELEDLSLLFKTDDHDVWYMSEEKKAEYMGMPGSGGNEDQDDGSGGGSGSDDGSDGQTEQEGGGGSSGSDDRSGGDRPGSAAAMQQRWKELAQRMQEEIQMFSNGHLGPSGNLMQNLREVNREKYDYASFLRKFAVMGEAMKINDDEFDYIFYTYGLKLYDKMPLIEPLEYKEVKRIKEFVIAIDTSGSVAGDLVQTFVQKTYNVLKSTESFFSRINLHIIQCDNTIQEHVKITNQDEFDEYIKHVRLRGFGGTDFRPVFRFVDKLVKDKEFVNLKGLIYFTDGYGTFPEQKPDYETAFVFINDRYEVPEVPPWVIRLVLEKEDV